MIKKQFTLYIENRSSALAAITHKLASEKINIEGISVSGTPDVGLVQLVPSNAMRTKKLLTRLKVPFTIQEVSVVSLHHKPGSLSEVICKLTESGVTVSYIYATGCSCGGKGDCGCYVVISADDLKRVEKVWKKIVSQPVN